MKSYMRDESRSRLSDVHLYMYIIVRWHLSSVFIAVPIQNLYIINFIYLAFISNFIYITLYVFIIYQELQNRSFSNPHLQLNILI